MADGAGKLDRLTRLKNLRSGMKAKAVSSADDADTLELDTLFDEEGDGADAPQEQAAPTTAHVADTPAAKTEDSDPESLSAYFEALGIVPDSAKIAPVAKTPPTNAPSAAVNTPDPAPAPDPAPTSKGRDVDVRDRWADPVREDDMFLASFAGEATMETSDDDSQSLDSIIGSFDDEENAGPVTVEPEPEPEPEPAAGEGPGESDTSTDAIAQDDTAEQVADTESDVPDDSASMEFGNEIDIDAFEREIALAHEKKAAVTAASDLSDDLGIPDDLGPEPDTDPKATSESVEGAPLTFTFDAGRAATLAQVSEQMGCSIDDVVVTALDWYLDALFGEDEQVPGVETGD